jgi:hypothetical protein
MYSAWSGVRRWSDGDPLARSPGSQLVQHAVSLLLKALQLAPNPLERGLKPSHAPGRVSGLGALDRVPRDDRVPHGVVGQVAVHPELTLHQLLLAAKPADLIADPLEPPLGPPHSTKRIPAWSADWLPMRVLREWRGRRQIHPSAPSTDILPGPRNASPNPTIRSGNEISNPPLCEFPNSPALHCTPAVN